MLLAIPVFMIYGAWARAVYFVVFLVLLVGFMPLIEQLEAPPRKRGKRGRTGPQGPPRKHWKPSDRLKWDRRNRGR